LHIAFKEAIATKLPKGTKYDRFWADEFLKKLKEDQIEKTTEKMLTFTNAKEANIWFELFVNAIIKPKEKVTDIKKVVAEEKAAAVDDDNKWTKEEVCLLPRAIAKFPAGSPNRWEQIAKYIGGKKSVQVVTSMVNELKNKTLKGGPEAVIR